MGDEKVNGRREDISFFLTEERICILYFRRVKVEVLREKTNKLFYVVILRCG